MCVCVCMRGGTVDGMTEEKIEMDRAERKRMGELSKRAKQRQAGSVRQKQEIKEEGKVPGWMGMGWGCVMCHVWPGPPCVSRVAGLQGRVTWVCSRW